MSHFYCRLNNNLMISYYFVLVDVGVKDIFPYPYSVHSPLILSIFKWWCQYFYFTKYLPPQVVKCLPVFAKAS